LRQEFGNLAMFLRPPKPKRPAPIPQASPEGRVAGEDVVAIADSILAHRFPLLGITIETGPEIDWRRDYLHKISSGTEYFRRVPYLDFARAGDHKVVWELNRHQHLVVMAQAFRQTGRREYLDEALRQFESWIAANPFLRGINWASALEVAFRAISWMWFWRLAGNQIRGPFADRFRTELYRHGCFLELNLSMYFSPNTHLLGEAVALHALGVFFDKPEWRASGGRIVAEEMQRQVREDGSHFEQSAYYHVYALDFFLLHRSLAAVSPAYDQRLSRMACYLDALMGVSGVLPLIGDDDGGRLFHPYGDRTRFGRDTLAACAALFGPAPPRTSQLFHDAGTAVMVDGDVQIVIKAGGFGEGSGGHSHSDVLSLVLRIGDREILIDPGTYTYIADPAERNAFRGSAAHSTVRIDGRDQAVPAGPFRWNDKPAVRVDEWSVSPEVDVLVASCEYGGFRHRRRVVFEKPARVQVVDVIEGPPGEHTVEGFWHIGSAEDRSRFSLSGEAECVGSWRSRTLCSKERAVALRVKQAGTLPVRLETTISVA
jgi:hypothetical protein